MTVERDTTGDDVRLRLSSEIRAQFSRDRSCFRCECTAGTDFSIFSAAVNLQRYKLTYNQLTALIYVAKNVLMDRVEVIYRLGQPQRRGELITRSHKSYGFGIEIEKFR